MARAGRKRKIGPRHPGGQLVDSQPDNRHADDLKRASRQPGRKLMPENVRTAYEAESPIGRLLLCGYLRSKADNDDVPARDRYNAGTMYAHVVGAYRAVIGS